MNKIEKDIYTLKLICQELENNYDNSEWDLSNYHKDELFRITGLEEHDWDESNLAHFIDGIQRAIHLIGVYNGN